MAMSKYIIMKIYIIIMTVTGSSLAACIACKKWTRRRNWNRTCIQSGV